MGRQADETRNQYWRGVIDQQKLSGLSITEFCRERKIHMGSFFNWRKRLTPSLPAPLPVPATSATPTAKFIPLELPPPSNASSHAGVEIVLPSGCRLVVPPKFDVDSLRDIVGVLKESSC